MLYQFIKQKLDGAKWFIEAIKQRQQEHFVRNYAFYNVFSRGLFFKW